MRIELKIRLGRNNIWQVRQNRPETQFQTLSHSKIRPILCLAKEVSERLACKATPRHFQDLLFSTPFLNSVCLCLAKKVSECLAHEATVSLTGLKCRFDSGHHK